MWSHSRKNEYTKMESGKQRPGNCKAKSKFKSQKAKVKSKDIKNASFVVVNFEF